MKTLHIFLAILMAASTFSTVTAQSKADLSKETIKVWGNCGMCKVRIEKAAKEAGATTAVWNEETKMLSVSYLSSKTSLTAIEQKIAAAGHDTQNVLAGEDGYTKLPGCCKYDRKTPTAEAMASRCNDSAKCDGDNCCNAPAGNTDYCKGTSEKTACCSKEKTCCSK